MLRIVKHRSHSPLTSGRPLERLESWKEEILRRFPAASRRWLAHVKICRSSSASVMCLPRPDTLCTAPCLQDMKHIDSINRLYRRLYLRPRGPCQKSGQCSRAYSDEQTHRNCLASSLPDGQVTEGLMIEVVHKVTKGQRQSLYQHCALYLRGNGTCRRPRML